MPEHTPPRAASRLLLWFLRSDLAEEVLGDLEEQFYHHLQAQGPRQARLNYWYQVIAYLRPFALGLKGHHPFMLLAMLRHIFTLTLRNARRHSTSFLINALGLSSGLAFALLIYLWVVDEYRVDAFHEKGDRLYLVGQVMPMGGGMQVQVSATPALLGEAMEQELPEVAQSVMVMENWRSERGIIAHQENRFKAKELYVGASFFEVFSFEMIHGSARQALARPSGVLISDQMARRLFGSTEGILGKTVQWEQDWFKAGGLYEVAGVFRHPPEYSSLQFDLLFGFRGIFERNLESFDRWDTSSGSTYLVLKEDADAAAFAEKIKPFVQQKLASQQSEEDQAWHLTLHPFADQYLHGNGRIIFVKIFATIALFILLIAAINFMNLSTARAARRMREVGVKKAMGVTRRQLAVQFLGEAVLLSLFSFVLAIGWVLLLMPQFNTLTDKALSLSLAPIQWFYGLGMAMLLGLLAGSYPALYLSHFHPSEVLKGKLAHRAGPVWLRRGLVVFQFTISIFFIMAVLVGYQQTRMIQSYDLGYNRDQVIVFAKEGLEGKWDALAEELRQIPGVEAISSAQNNLAKGRYGISQGLSWTGDPEEKNLTFANLSVDYDYLALMQMELTAGRSFDRKFGADSLKAIFNQTAIEKMGLEDPIGQQVEIGNRPYEIIGVVGDFHYASLHQEIRPMFFTLKENNPQLYMRLSAGLEAETLAQIEERYEAFTQGLPFEYSFMDHTFAEVYADERRVTVLAQYFALIAIVISCLGLLGLVAYTTERRTQEISIRRVLGASTSSLVRLLGWEFVLTVLVALTIALPLSYWAMSQWLQNYAARIELHAGYFLLAGLIGLAVAWLTIGLQTLRVARSNPAETLRAE